MYSRQWYDITIEEFRLFFYVTCFFELLGTTRKLCQAYLITYQWINPKLPHALLEARKAWGQCLHDCSPYPRPLNSHDSSLCGSKSKRGLRTGHRKLPSKQLKIPKRGARSRSEEPLFQSCHLHIGSAQGIFILITGQHCPTSLRHIRRSWIIRSNSETQFTTKARTAKANSIGLRSSLSC